MDYLQQLINMVGSAGEGAFWLTVIYLSLDALKTLAIAGGIFGSIVYVASRVYRGCVAANAIDNLVTVLENKGYKGKNGLALWTGNDYDRRQAVDIVNQHLPKAKRKK